MQGITIITVGDELLLGQVVDTNSAWIADELSHYGVAVGEIISVGDTSAAISSALDRALACSSVVIVTGGLGPTKDDLTKRAVADYFGVCMHRDQAVFEHVQNMMEARGVDFNELNQAQADIPHGFVALSNAVGTAPGLMRDLGDKLLFCLPGVPFELKQLFGLYVLPSIIEKFTLSVVVSNATVLVYGLPESELAMAIGEWERALPRELKLAYLPNPRGIRLRLSWVAAPDERSGEVIAERFEALHEIIPQYYVGYEPASLESSLAEMLMALGGTVSTAESCSGGVIASRFAAMAGASAYFKGGVVAYDNEVKIGVLGVDRELIERYGAVSTQVAEAMAAGAIRITGSDYAISTTGTAGPSGGTEQKPIGTVCVAVAGKNGDTWSVLKNFGQPRGVCIDRASSFAINSLRIWLMRQIAMRK